MATSTSVATPGVRVPPIGEAGFSTSAAVLPGHVALRTHPECRTAMNSPDQRREPVLWHVGDEVVEHGRHAELPRRVRPVTDKMVEFSATQQAAGDGAPGATA